MAPKGSGGSFTSDFGAMTGTGRTQTSTLLGGGAGDILSEEKRLIEKVFAIVDKDNSGSIDTNELKAMFAIFGVETDFLSTAITRIMSNVDKDHDGMISPQEFYRLLSQKFEKGDPKKEIEEVFRRIDTKKDGKLDVEELKAVSDMLGEALTKQDIKDMIRTFRSMHEESSGLGGPKKADDAKSVATQDDPNLELSFDHWYFVMTQDL